tara:strand:- start:295 stop:663 length:369 start_codon:yes stop_codon:yes gene_type:complete
MSSCCVTNVKVRFIRPQYDNLKEWMEDENNVYIGRRGIVFIKTEDDKKERYPKKDSKWCNPFKIGKIYTRESCLEAYEEYILKKIENEPEIYNLEELKGKNLGCWCHPEACHGDILKKILEK